MLDDLIYDGTRTTSGMLASLLTVAQRCERELGFQRLPHGGPNLASGGTYYLPGRKAAKFLPTRSYARLWRRITLLFLLKAPVQWTLATAGFRYVFGICAKENPKASLMDALRWSSTSQTMPLCDVSFPFSP